MEALPSRLLVNRNFLFILILVMATSLPAMHNFRRFISDDYINYYEIRNAVCNNDRPRLTFLLNDALQRKQKIAGELDNKLSAFLHDPNVTKATARILIDYGAKANHRDDLSETPMHHCKAGVVDLLITHGAEVNATNQVGNAPLFHAASRKKVTKVMLLVERGASIGNVNKRGRTAIDIAGNRMSPDDTFNLPVFLMLKHNRAKSVLELIQNREVYGTFRSPY